jgi:hypothetical protein
LIEELITKNKPFKIETASGRVFEVRHRTISIPKSVRLLSVDELPAGTRLRSVLKRAGIRNLGQLHGHDLCELLKQRHCGVRTISVLQQLIQRAVSGEFDHSRVNESNVPQALLDLSEKAIARLPHGDRQFLLRRIGAGGRRPLTYEQLGRQRRITRERARKTVEKLFELVRKTFGPRIPQLLMLLKKRCFSNVCPLTPELLKEWGPGFQSRLRLSFKAHVRIIGALDKSIPTWARGHDLSTHVYDDSRDLGVQLATIARDAGGSISVAQAYRRLKTQRGYQSLNVAEFLRLLRTARRIRIEFDRPQKPTIRAFRRLIHRRRQSLRKRQ